MSNESDPKPEMLKDMQVLRLRPGDVIVLKYPGVLCKDAWGNIKKSMTELFPDNHCTVLEEGMNIGVVSKQSPDKAYMASNRASAMFFESRDDAEKYACSGGATSDIEVTEITIVPKLN